MQENPLISVVIPSYNRANTILRAVNSVLNQTYKNLELIVVDDCSTDNTQEILSQIKDERLHIIKHEKNKGQNASRNTGTLASHGELLACHDSDDVWHKDKLEKQLAFLQKTGADVVSAMTAVHDEESGVFTNYHPDLKKVSEGKITYETLLKYNCTTTQTFFGKAECFKTILFDENQPRFTDWALALDMVQTYTLYFQEEVLADVFQQKDSITKNPARGIAGMDMLYQKHKAAIDANPSVKATFFLKKAGAVWRSGKSPTEELSIVWQNEKSLKNLLKLTLARLHLYGIAGKLLGK